MLMEAEVNDASSASAFDALPVGAETSASSAVNESINNNESDVSLPKQSQQQSSKLESLSKEDLIKLVKKQLINQKEIKKQLEASKNEAATNADLVKEMSAKLAEGKQDGGAASMLSIELKDYKNASVLLKKELQECKDALAQKDSLIEELSQRIAGLQEEKEQSNEQLRQKLAEAAEQKQCISEKSAAIAENSKEISSLVAQLHDSRQQMQEEIGALQESLRAQTAQLVTEQRALSAKCAEWRRLKCENETLESRTKNIEEEFRNYKERAEFVFKSKNAPSANINEGSSENSAVGDLQNIPSGVSPQAFCSNKSTTATFNSEINQLLELLRQRNVEITQLSTKCSFLEEEVRSGQSYSKTLMDELNALHDSISEIRRQSLAERQRICAEFEQRLKLEEARRVELESELKAATEREVNAALDSAAQDGQKWRLECERLTKELEEMQRKLLTFEEKRQHSPTTTSSQFPQKNNRKTSTGLTNVPTALLQKRLQHSKMAQQHNFNKFLLNNSGNASENVGEAISSPSPPIRCSGMEFTAGDNEVAVGTTLNSESSADSLEDLQSMLQEAEIAPNSALPSINVAAVPSDVLSLDGLLRMPSGPVLPRFFSETEYTELQQQLDSCRELLSESEEINIRLNEQVNLLKEEIRRVERNQQRAKNLENEVCSEYFKNIVLKFLAPPRVSDERAQLLPVLQTILHLDEREMDLVKMNCLAGMQGASQIYSNSGGEQPEGSAGFGAWLGWK